MAISPIEASISVTDASIRGVSRLVADAEAGAAVVVARRGKPAAVVLGIDRFQSILDHDDDLRSAALVLARAATDDGTRIALDDVITAFGFDKDELETELDAEIAAGFTDDPSVTDI